MKICVFTATRAEYGLFYWLLKGLKADSRTELSIVASGTHLSSEHGMTVSEIESDGFVVDAKIEMLLSSDTSVGVVKSMGLGMIGYADELNRIAPDCVVVLGDRYETLAFAQAALLMKLPIVHIHGGEITEGAYDDMIRHSLTKMASLHFCAMDEHRNRIIQMGEQPCSVYRVGALGLDNILKTELPSLTEVEGFLGFDLTGRYVVVTYHPVTMAEEPPVESFKAMMDALLGSFEDLKIVVTHPNADDGGHSIMSHIQDYVTANPSRVVSVASLGFRRYLSTVKYSQAVVGNSSSGVIEVPSLGVPTVNIGERQRGRTCANSVIHCSATRDAVSKALSVAFSGEFQSLCEDVVNPYGDGGAVEKILPILLNTMLTRTKPFYNIDIGMNHE